MHFPGLCHGQAHVTQPTESCTCPKTEVDEVWRSDFDAASVDQAALPHLQRSLRFTQCDQREQLVTRSVPVL